MGTLFHEDSVDVRLLTALPGSNNAKELGFCDLARVEYLCGVLIAFLEEMLIYNSLSHITFHDKWLQSYCFSYWEIIKFPQNLFIKSLLLLHIEHHKEYVTFLRNADTT